MQEIIISQSVKALLPELVLGCIECNVVIAEELIELWSKIETVCSTFKESIDLLKKYANADNFETIFVE